MELSNFERFCTIFHEAWVDYMRSQGVSSHLSDFGEEMMAPYADLSDEAKQSIRDSLGSLA